MGNPFTPEFRLAVACCRFPRDDAARAATLGAIAQITSWKIFDKLVERHRIDGLVNIALAEQKGVPSEVRSNLAARARDGATLDLILAAETANLQQRFDEAGMPALFVKGATIGVLAYGALGIKRSWDIDLLITPDLVASALQLLEREGFQLVSPPSLNKQSLERFVRFHHEALVCNARGIPVELHWRLSSKAHVLPGVNARSPYQLVAVGGRQVKTLSDDLLIPYLIAHGQGHGWGRLKWLADLNAMLVGRSADDILQLQARAQALGLGDGASATLILCNQLFGLALPKEELVRRRSVERLVHTYLACMSHPLGGSDLPDVSGTNMMLVVSRIRFAAGWRDLVGELGAIWTQPSVRARLPAPLDFLYHVFRIPLFLARLPLKLLNLRRTSHSNDIQ